MHGRASAAAPAGAGVEAAGGIGAAGSIGAATTAATAATAVRSGSVDTTMMMTLVGGTANNDGSPLGAGLQSGGDYSAVEMRQQGLSSAGVSYSAPGCLQQDLEFEPVFEYDPSEGSTPRSPEMPYKPVLRASSSSSSLVSKSPPRSASSSRLTSNITGRYNSAGRTATGESVRSVRFAEPAWNTRSPLSRHNEDDAEGADADDDDNSSLATASTFMTTGDHAGSEYDTAPHSPASDTATDTATANATTTAAVAAAEAAAAAAAEAAQRAARAAAMAAAAVRATSSSAPSSRTPSTPATPSRVSAVTGPSFVFPTQLSSEPLLAEAAWPNSGSSGSGGGDGGVTGGGGGGGGGGGVTGSSGSQPSSPERRNGKIESSV